MTTELVFVKHYQPVGDGFLVTVRPQATNNLGDVVHLPPWLFTLMREHKSRIRTTRRMLIDMGFVNHVIKYHKILISTPIPAYHISALDNRFVLTISKSIHKSKFWGWRRYSGTLESCLNMIEGEPLVHLQIMDRDGFFTMDNSTRVSLILSQ